MRSGGASATEWTGARELVLDQRCSTERLQDCLSQLGELEVERQLRLDGVLVDSQSGALRSARLMGLVQAGPRPQLAVDPVALDARVSCLVPGPRVELAKTSDWRRMLPAVIDGLGLPSQGKLRQLASVRLDRLELRCGCGAASFRIAVDRVTGRRAGRKGAVEVRGLRLALSEGPPAARERLERELLRRLSLRVRRRGVADRVLSQLGLLADEPTLRVALDPTADARAACGLLWSRLFAALSAFEWGARVGLDDEHVHKMRVVTRRLRAALDAFAGCFPADELRQLRDTLKWLTDVLGLVRDLDVQVRDLPLWSGRIGGEPQSGWRTLEATLMARRQRAREELRLALSSERYLQLGASGERMFAATPARLVGSAAPAEPTVAAVADVAIRRRVKRFRRSARACRRSGEAEAVHLLRIRGKQLRYAAELFKTLYGRRYLRRLDGLARLQDGLGRYQDSVVMGQLARALARDAVGTQPQNSAYAFVLGALAGYGVRAARAATNEIRWALETLDVRRDAARLAQIATELADKGAA